MTAIERNMKKLYEPLALGRLTLPNRLVMAPMTRDRAAADGVLASTRFAMGSAHRWV